MEVRETLLQSILRRLNLVLRYPITNLMGIIRLGLAYTETLSESFCPKFSLRNIFHGATRSIFAERTSRKFVSKAFSTLKRV